MSITQRPMYALLFRDDIGVGGMDLNRGRAITVLSLLVLSVVGCSRTRHRLQADSQTYCLLNRYTESSPWTVGKFRIDPDPRSRFFDASCPDDPSLPVPAPQLYAYDLPQLTPRSDMRTLEEASSEQLANLVRLPSVLNVPTSAQSLVTAEDSPLRGPTDGARDLVGSQNVRLVSYQPVEPPIPEDKAPDPIDASPTEVRRPPVTNSGSTTPSDGLSDSYDRPLFESLDDIIGKSEFTITGLRLAAIPAETWESLPRRCLTRMLEFESVRLEYRNTFDREPSNDLRDSARSLSLEDILELAVINSRDYQSQKESLYRAALQLTLEQYAYQLRFTRGGNGTDLNYSHRNSGGITENGLSIPSRLAVERTLARGGRLLARFANDIVLTFNGPSGFSADVGSELFTEISQSLFQRDIVLESLTQTERNLIYSARDFARFRKRLFRDLASQYYRLLLTYRGIEIDAQDYFSNLRGFNQGEAEYRGGRLPRFQVDQIEQRALDGRSRLIGSCNSLENSLDQLKFRIGLPTETPLNVRLVELEAITLRDEATVSYELVRRSRRALVREREQSEANTTVMLNTAIDLSRRMGNLVVLQDRITDELADSESQTNMQDEQSLQALLAELHYAEANLEVLNNRTRLAAAHEAMPAAPPLRIFQRNVELIESLLILSARQQILADQTEASSVENSSSESEIVGLRRRLSELTYRLDRVIADRELMKLPDFVVESAELLRETEQSNRLLGRDTGFPEQSAVEIISTIDDLVVRALDLSEPDAQEQAFGLTPIEIGMDEAMMTSLLQRFDLMNRRGELADSWRQIKLAGDDLRSVLNLRASQAIRTRNDVNRPFDFTFDESQTRLAVDFDAPLNRRSQRNSYRRALINYNAALRNVMRVEDQIKLDIRSDLRALQLDREQYQIAVASAALAKERVISTRLQMQLGLQNIAARDFLESQQAYTASLNSVAREHIGYILDRIELFLDMELLYVDELGFWPELYNESLQPQPYLAFPEYARPAYGYLPCEVRHSDCVRRMYGIPDGDPSIYDSGLQTEAETSGGGTDSSDTSPDNLPLQPPEPYATDK